MANTKDLEVITFKVDKALVKLLKGIPNRSEFIRVALLEALDNLCPFCRGTGVLTPHRKKHWDELAKHHGKKECRQCHEDVLVCSS
ncbi:MAG: CopG family transcriptional regulator [Candidatus Omnitrophica bacterium]|nr:CopG family transcriptional regulator [Candidatus Omnitrophota bacterium]